MADLGVNITMGLIKTGVFIFDIISYPFFAVVQKPWRKQRLMEEKKAERIACSEGVTFRSISPLNDRQIDLARRGVNTLEKAFDYALNKFADEKCVGTRKVLNEFSEVQPNGKVFKKLELGDYSWLTYAETNEKALNFGRGLILLGHQPKENILIFSETRAEWFISAVAGFKQNIPVCTLYATLGEESIIHGINETETRVIITSHELLPKVKAILKHTPRVEKVIYFPDQLEKTDTSGCGEGITFYAFEEVVQKGIQNSIRVSSPSPDDIAFIMYTSGSTGVPKGVIISHYNLVSAMIAYTGIIERKSNDIFLAYLPLAHVLELIAELTMVLSGIPLGYSSPLTMTDRSTKIKRGCPGDVTALKPTLMTAVPLILDRIYKGILEKVAAQGPFLKALFDFGVHYRMKWSSCGWETPFCNWFVFRKIRALLGGHIRMIATGGAPLNSDTHSFIKAALGVPVMQGYGLTESCGCATVMSETDTSTGRVGGPLPICDVKLVDWEEGNYRTSDEPNPRGEIFLGGTNVTMGYLKNEQKTREDFLDVDGRRWFKTGDIGEIQPDGSLKIIDRKKDLVKLQIGEYVSLGKVEAELKVSPLVDNICVYGESSKNNIVAIVSPNKEKLEALAASMNKTDLSLETLCNDSDIINHMLEELVSIGKRVKLEKFEFPTALYLTHEIWSPDSGLVTAAFKLKRKQIQTKYQKEINRMYGRHGG